ncbi:unnamed protein product [Parascedosporium putredinis]|uniref:Uncharacterized protein n=1 Tax=Parascedosporium putredinis TaxID=1442378 RepID=A0A9P1MAA9_9PEZI|nr:unnamed protein product [Parascedosporium putredinis]CAI7996273.1 unnamed protein product [Parascedosporium putredinis]
MKAFFTAVFLPIAALAAATPAGVAPPSAASAPRHLPVRQLPAAGWGWAVCNAQGDWVRGGDCKRGEFCSMNPLNASPYCLPVPEGECPRALPLHREQRRPGWSIDVCNEAGRWAERVRCPSGQVCRYGAVRGYPYCTAP